MYFPLFSVVSIAPRYSSGNDMYLFSKVVIEIQSQNQNENSGCTLPKTEKDTKSIF